VKAVFHFEPYIYGGIQVKFGKVYTCLAAVIVLLSACAVLNFYKKLDTMIMAGQYADAAGVIETEKAQYKGEHELLYFFDKGAVLQMTGDYAGSITYLEQAELKIESLYTKSVTKELSSYFSNDMNLPYEGEDFEQVMVNIMKCLDFMYEGDFDGAQVEARKVDHRLNVIGDRNEGKNIYREDAFARYLSGIANEAKGDMNDAYIDYKKAYKGFKQYNELFGTPIPFEVKKDILRSADAMKFKDEINEFQQEFGDIEYTRYRDSLEKGEAVIIVYCGMAPYKISKFMPHQEKSKDGKRIDTIQVAFPHFTSRGYAIASAEASAKGEQANDFLAEDINSIAIKSLENKNLLIQLKAIARAVAKFQMTKAIDNNGKNKLLGLLAGIYSVASEQADTRSWRTLPAAFRMIRLPLEPGKQSIKLKLNMASGDVRELEIPVTIKKGKKTVVPVFAYN
jgi:uncharacterized protein